MIIWEDASARVEAHLSQKLRLDTGGVYHCEELWSNGDKCGTIFIDGLQTYTFVCQKAFAKEEGLRMPFICKECAASNHQGCPGGAQCDCQHRSNHA